MKHMQHLFSVAPEFFTEHRRISSRVFVRAAIFQLIELLERGHYSLQSPLVFEICFPASAAWPILPRCVLYALVLTGPLTHRGGNRWGGGLPALSE